MIDRSRILLLMVAGAACEQAAPPAVVIRDSAGVAIVLNTMPAPDTLGCGWGSPEGWLRDSILDDDLFGISGGVILDGHLAVLSSGTGQFHLYNLHTLTRVTSSRKGSGPGELLQPANLILLPPDSFLVSDYANRRISIFDWAGVFRRSFTLDPMGGLGHQLPLGVLSDRSLLVQTGLLYGPGATGGLRRDTLQLLRYTLEGALVDTVGTFLGPEALIEGSSTGVTVTSPPFERWTELTVMTGHIVVADNAEPVIHWKNADGTTIRLSRVNGIQSALRVGQYKEEVQKRLEETDNPQIRLTLESLFKKAEDRSRAPAFGTILAEDDARLWIRHFPMPTDTATSWTVLDSLGRYACQVRIGDRLKPIAVADGILVGTTRGPHDEEQIKVLRFLKP